MSAIPQAISDYIDNNADKFIQRLAEAVSIPSVSTDAAHREHVFKMSDWIDSQMKQLGIDTKQVPVGNQILDGKELKLPNVVLGTLGNDPRKKTILLYGHFDVQPVSHTQQNSRISPPKPSTASFQALKSDGWSTDPFTLVQETDGRLVGRGATDDKGPILGCQSNFSTLPLTVLTIPRG